MTGFSSLLKDTLLLGLLMLCTKATAFPPVQTYALDKWGDKLCMVEMSGHQSTLVCNHNPRFQQALAGEELPEGSQFLTRCPKEWVDRKNCTVITVQRSIPQSTMERLQNLLYSAYSSLSNQLSLFLHNSMDDLVEDIISIGIPFKASYSRYPKSYTGIIQTVLLFELMNLMLCPIGDVAGDIVEYFQNGHYHTEGETELSVRGIISNKVEDHVKIVGYVVCYKSTIIIQYLENYYIDTSEDMTDGPVAEVGTRVGLFLIKRVAFAYNTIQMAEHYSWVNEISDTLSDLVIEMLDGEH